MKRVVTFLAALTLLLVSAREAKSGSVWDAVADFNLTGTNPLSSNPWAYGNESTLGGAFTPLASYQNVNVPGVNMFEYFWGLYNNGFSGAGGNQIGKNTSGGTIVVNASTPIVWPNDVLLVAPGGIYSQGFGPTLSAPDFSVVQWTAPTAGSYSLSGTFTNLQASGADLHILVNGTSIYSNNLNGSTGPNPQPFSATNLNLGPKQACTQSEFTRPGENNKKTSGVFRGIGV
jgi:hypothetical protein